MAKVDELVGLHIAVPVQRLAQQRMLRDCERGVFKAVICWKMDRFARNRYDSAMYKYKLKKNGVRIFYAKESIPEGPEGIILESVMEGYAEYYSENLSQNVKRGYYDSALELKTLGQTVLGLRKGADGRFELDPATAPVVRRIFEEYAAGDSAKEIYTRLNAEGYRTSRGGLFNKNSLRRILQNEKPFPRGKSPRRRPTGSVMKRRCAGQRASINFLSAPIPTKATFTITFTTIPRPMTAPGNSATLSAPASPCGGCLTGYAWNTRYLW